MALHDEAVGRYDELHRELNAIDLDARQIVVENALMALESIAKLQKRLDTLRPALSTYLRELKSDAMTIHVISQGVSSGPALAHSGADAARRILETIEIRERWAAVSGGLDRARSEALGWLSIALGLLSIILAIVPFFLTGH